MRRYLLDTGVMGDFLSKRRGVDERVRDARRRGDRIGIGIPTYGELVAGFECSSSRDRNLQRLRRALARTVGWPFNVEAADEYGRIYAELRRLGRTIGQIDMQIAAIARSLGNCTVVSRDSDFAAVPNLSVEDWST